MVQEVANHLRELLVVKRIGHKDVTFFRALDFEQGGAAYQTIQHTSHSRIMNPDRVLSVDLLT